MEQPVFRLVVIRASDIERAAWFYSRIGLHFQKHRHGSGAEHFASENGPVVFEIYPRQGENDSTVGVRIGFRVASVDAALEALASAGVVVLSPAKDSPWGRRAVVEDPEGHRVELTE